MGEFGVSDKEPKRNSSTNSSSVLGVKQTLHEAFPSKAGMMMMMLQHHNHHHRPFSPFDGDGDGDGPTPYYNNTSLTNHINVFSGASALTAAAIDSGAAAIVRSLQPFDISAITTPSPFKSTGGMMAASSLGFPFTSAQWKELQRQAMIFKYMMASVPVPSDLLIPTSATPSRSPLGGGFNLRLSNSTDPEPGRCRRTDGKKWRCARDVAPNHKYCERHMHRGRPRSRKPVEVHTNNNNDPQQIKRARHDCSNPFPTSGGGVTVAVPNNPIITRKDETSSTQFLVSPATQQPYLQSSLSLNDNYSVKAANFGSVASVSSNKEPRGLEWMLNGDPISLGASDSEWHSLMNNKVGLTPMSSCNNTEPPQYLNSYALYNNSGLDQQNRRPPLALNPLLVPMENLQSEKPRGFIDAWSNTTETEENNPNNQNSVASLGKLSLSSLDLSMGGGGGSVHEDMGTIEMGLGLMEPDGGNTNNGTKPHLSNWLTPSQPCWLSSTTPGGPLAEVLRPSTTVTATTNEANNSNPSSPVITNAESSSPLGGTMASSPSGVLQKTLASFSDSSSNSSPTVASSRANSEMALLRFNHK